MLHNFRVMWFLKIYLQVFLEFFLAASFLDPTLSLIQLFSTSIAKRNKGKTLTWANSETDCDLKPFAAMLASGQTSPQTTKYKETTRN